MGLTTPSLGDHLWRALGVGQHMVHQALGEARRAAEGWPHPAHPQPALGLPPPHDVLGRS